jgi:hypothetical protein
LICLAGTAEAFVLTASHDTYVQRDDKSTVRGSNTSFLIKTQNGLTNTRIGFLRFDSSSLTGGTATDAVLALHFYSVEQNQEVNLYGIPETSPDELFDEASFDYDAADSVGGGGNPDNSLNESKLTFIEQIVVSSGTDGVLTFDSAALLSFINADTNGTVSFVVNHDNYNNNITSIASREYSDVDTPRAVPTLTVIPEPASLTLLAGGGLCLLPRRRR